MMPFYPADWILDTQDLSPEAYVAYHRLLCNMWLNRDCALPDDPKILASRAGFSARRWPFIWLQIERFFIEAEGVSTPLAPRYLTSYRLVRERDKARAKYAARSEAGARGARAKWQKTKGSTHGKANGKDHGKTDGKTDGKPHGNHNHTGINTSARAGARGLSEFQIKWIQDGKAPSPMPSGTQIRNAIEDGQITAEQAAATMRGFF